MMAFDLQESNARTGVFDVTAYFNNSATEGGQRGVVDAAKTHNGNWIPITNMIVEAIYGKLVGKGKRPAVKLQSFPSKFNCNRDEWLEGKADLDCPGLIPAQLQGSPLDSILDVFLPIILMLGLDIVRSDPLAVFAQLVHGFWNTVNTVVLVRFQGGIIISIKARI